MTEFQSRLCIVCQNALDMALGNDDFVATGWGIVPHHHTKDSLADSVLSRGCHLCLLMLDYYTPLGPEEEEGSTPSQILKAPSEEDFRASDLEYPTLPMDRLSIRRVVGSLPEDIRLTVHINYWGKVPGALGSLWFHCASLPRPHSHGPRFRIESIGAFTGLAGHNEFDKTTAATSCQKLAVEWLDRCEKYHDTCIGGQEKFRPTRLLDLASVDITRKVRLVLSEECNRDESYVTLSHCWGSNVPFRLTTKTLETMRVGFDLEELPKTFRDAIEIAGWFQVRYIWIDSCCIVQDSADDWLHEAEMMEKVYENTYLNISADHSKDATGGCFTERLVYKVAPCRYKAPRIGWVKLVAPFAFMKSLDNSALSERAWVVQERLMSPRVLHFTDVQLFWECAELFACETFAEGLPTSYDGESSRHYRDNRSLVSIDQRGRPDYYKMWCQICQDYSRGMLTDLSDKLIAFSGIAREFQSRLPRDKYLAGIWKEDLVSGLLWSVPTVDEMPIQANGAKDDCAMPFIAASPTPKFRAPSWSWLSIDGHVSWSLSPDAHPIVRLLEATVDLVNDGDPSGAMRGGSIVIRGQLRSASWMQKGGLDLVVLDGKHGDQMHELLKHEHSPQSGFFSIQRDTGSMFPVKDIFCLLVRRFARSTYRHNEMIEGLVLRSTEVEDTYQRLGHFGARGIIPCMALKYKLRPLAQEMDRPWDKFRLPPLDGKKRDFYLDSTIPFDVLLKLQAKASKGSAEALPADTYLGDAPYDETLFEKLEDRTITLI